MKEIRVKALIYYLQHYHSNFELFKKFPSDKRITAQEKRLLLCWVYLRDKKFSEIKTHVLQMKNIDDALVLGISKLLMGICLNNNAENDKSIIELKEAMYLLKDYPVPYFHFLSAYNLAIASYNTLNLPMLELAIKKLDSLESLSENLIHRVWLAKIQKHLAFEEWSEAEEYVMNLEENIKKLDESSYASFLTVKFVFLVACKQLDKAEKTFQKMKEVRKFHPSFNFKFIKMVLGFIQHQKPIYFYDRDFKDHFILNHQLKILSNLYQNKRKEAESSWTSLQLIMPHLYQDDFKYKGIPCLFSLALEKCQPESYEFISEEFNEDSNFEKVVKILNKHKKPINKDDLYFLIWGKYPQEKSDYRKLIKSINRLRLKGHKIKYQSGCYFLKAA